MIDSGRLAYDNIHIERGPVIEGKDTLITRGTFKATGSWDGKSMIDHLAYTMIWRKQGSEWQLLSEHNSRMPPPKQK